MIILEDHPLVTVGLEAIVKSAYPEVVVFTQSTVDQALNTAKNTSIDLSIVDINLNGESGFEFVRRCYANNLGGKHMIVTSSLYNGDFKKAMELGVEGYLLKESMPEDLLYALKVVLGGSKFVDSHFINDQFSSNHKKAIHDLTGREHEILNMIGSGCTNAEIAQTLYISINTVKKHINHIFNKLELRNRADAILYCQHHLM